MERYEIFTVLLTNIFFLYILKKQRLDLHERSNSFCNSTLTQYFGIHHIFLYVSEIDI